MERSNKLPAIGGSEGDNDDDKSAFEAAAFARFFASASFFFTFFHFTEAKPHVFSVLATVRLGVLASLPAEGAKCLASGDLELCFTMT